MIRAHAAAARARGGPGWLDARAGDDGWSRRGFLLGTGAGLLCAAAGGWRRGPAPPLRDAFGGLIGARARRSAGAPPRFQVAKFGERWLLVTPAQHPYWMLGVFNVDLSASAAAGQRSHRENALAACGSEAGWARRANQRLQGWGFNCLAEYASEYTLPVALYGRSGNPQRLPFMAMVRPAAFSLRNRWNYAPGAVKDIVAATDPAIYTGWRGDTAPDVFDPNFSRYAAGEAAALAEHLGQSPYLLGVCGDDADDLFGFGPGPELAAARAHPHLGWLVLISQPEVSENTGLGVRYADPCLHAKLALQQWLQRRYGSVAGLNAAWKAGYTSFASDGGWPQGHGLLDESGRHPWVGHDAERLSGTAARLRQDLDDFLYLYAKTYFEAVAQALRRSFSGYLYFGPATLNGWNGLTRAPILRAAGAAVDVLQANAASDEVLERTVASAGEVPLVTWTGMAANADSDLFAFPHPGDGAPMVASQELRGAVYARRVAGEFARTARGRAHVVVGTKFWSYADSWAEKMNWGLVSLRDNAYDGREAVRARGRDHWGDATGGEERDYGDCLSAMQAANQALYRRMAEELGAAAGERS